MLSGPNVFLKLLADDAPRAAFYDVLMHDREDDDSLERDIVLALQVRERITEHEKRRAELEALYTTAGDLTSIRNVDEVLLAIIRRARDLLGADVSYMTLVEGVRGPTCVRASVGTTSPAFDRLRLMPGSGLGGLVAERCTPIVTSNYLDDPQIPHRADVDEIVAGERLVAMLGVPLRTTSGVLGVLFAANRGERSFTPDEVSLLSYLAAHAAIAITNARLFEESQELARKVEASRVELLEHTGIVEASIREHEKLTELVVEGGGAAEVAASLQGLLGGAILIVDADERVVAVGARGEAELEKAARELAVAAGRLPEEEGGDPTPRMSVRQLTLPDGSPAVGYVLPVAAGQRSLGMLYAALTAHAEQWQVQILERAGAVVALVFMNDDLVAHTEQQARGDLVNDLIDAGSRDTETVIRRARMLGLDLRIPHVVLVAEAEGPVDTLVRRGSAVARELGGIVGERAQQVVVILPGNEHAAASMFRQVSRGRGVTAAFSGPSAGVEGISSAYDHARRCLRIQQHLAGTGKLADATSLGVYGLLASELSEVAVREIVHDRLRVLEEFDARHDSRLVETLEAYYAHKRRLAAAADALHVHINTLYRRLERVSKLLGPDWDDPDEALQTSLALRLRRLSQELTDD